MLNQSCETPLLCIDPTIVTPPQDSSVLRGGTVRLFCQVAASPRFLIIRWTKNGANISKTGSRISHKSDKFHGVITQTLVISNASDSDSGQYRCIVKNRKGRISSKPAGLTVKSRLLILFYFILFLIIIFCGVGGEGGFGWGELEEGDGGTKGKVVSLYLDLCCLSSQLCLHHRPCKSCKCI